MLDPDALASLSEIDLKSLPLVEGNPRIGPCVAGTGKFICIGLNYSDHAAETGAVVPSEPIIFMKATSAIVGHEVREWGARRGHLEVGPFTKSRVEEQICRTTRIAKIGQPGSVSRRPCP